MSPKKTIENKKTSHEIDQPKMIKKEEEDDLRLPNKEDDDKKQEDIISKDLNNVRSSAHIDSKDSSGKSPELFCIADYEIPGDIPDFQTLVVEAVLGHNPSLTWRSILAGRQVLSVGIFRRIGNRAETLVGGDNWIPDFPKDNVARLCPNLCSQLKVEELTNGAGQWDRDKISNLFPQNICRSILSVPLSTSFNQDSWYWCFNVEGIYSVRSGYKEFRKVKLGDLISSDHMFQFSNVWKSIWKAKIPEKIKHFMWRAGREILPVCERLCHRGPAECLNFSLRSHQALGSAGGLLSSSFVAGEMDVAPSSFYKVNTDASLHADGKAGLGCVVRNWEGRVLAAMALNSAACSSAAQLEAEAVFKGVEMARDLGIKKVIVEGDCEWVW
ncbi:putative RNA-directed DNA polymerase [Senna tora]|uniref:Putative RNA-directed DNA polymerase n=1 Tax=Senna tora TaxID=362788 RepID=A0A834T7F3_9FABA|nr:putative RNA-directed DNA polymerase [Senna tora]